MMDKWKECISEIINNKEMNILDVYFRLFSECLKGATNPEQKFQYIIENVQGTIFSNNGQSLYISESIVNDYTEQYKKELVEYIRILSERNYTEDEFYSILYRYVFNGELYPKETVMQSYLLYLLAEETPGIPYYQAENLLKISNEEYKVTVDRIWPQIQKSVAMLNRNFASKTEETSQLYYLSQNLASDKERIIYWSVIMSILKNASKGEGEHPTGEI